MGLEPDTEQLPGAGGCLRCDDDLLHCHAVLILHRDGWADCAHGCAGDPLVHDVVVGCESVDHLCCHTGTAPLPQLLAG